MTRKLFLTTAAGILLGLGMTPSFGLQMPGIQMPASSQTDSHQKSLDVEWAMVNHQREMQALLVKLDESLQTITAARDAKGYVRNKAALKTHEANIKALRNAVRDHKRFLGGYEHQCGVTGKQQDAMVQHQFQMKGALHDVVESFDAFAQANDQPNNPYIYVTQSVEQAFTAHREALKELKDAVAQHTQAMAQMMNKCSLTELREP
jgi:hypothetical protein